MNDGHHNFMFFSPITNRVASHIPPRGHGYLCVCVCESNRATAADSIKWMYTEIQTEMMDETGDTIDYVRRVGGGAVLPTEYMQ